VFGAAGVRCCDRVFTRSAGTMIFLETQRLLFRTHEAGDEADFVCMHMDAEVRRDVGGAAWPLEKARSRFREQYLDKPLETYGLWATVFKRDGKYIGCSGLRAPGHGIGASIGCHLARPYWGRGLGRRRRGLSLTLLLRGWGLDAWKRMWKRATLRRNVFCRSADSNTCGGKQFPGAVASSISISWRKLNSSDVPGRDVITS
jgi:hypothetical protein